MQPCEQAGSILLAGCSGGGGGGGGGGNSAVSTPGAEEDNANLANLVVSNGVLVFNPDETTYTVEVDNSVSSMSMTPTLADPKASMVISGTAVESGQPFGPVTLTVGQNNFQITITAVDGSTIKTYTVVVNRLAGLSQNADLAGLLVSGRSFNAGLHSGHNQLHSRGPEYSRIHYGVTDRGRGDATITVKWRGRDIRNGLDDSIPGRRGCHPDHRRGNGGRRHPYRRPIRSR